MTRGNPPNFGAMRTTFSPVCDRCQERFSSAPYRERSGFRTTLTGPLSRVFLERLLRRARDAKAASETRSDAKTGNAEWRACASRRISGKYCENEEPCQQPVAVDPPAPRPVAPRATDMSTKQTPMSQIRPDIDLPEQLVQMYRPANERGDFLVVIRCHYEAEDDALPHLA